MQAERIGTHVEDTLDVAAFAAMAGPPPIVTIIASRLWLISIWTLLSVGIALFLGLLAVSAQFEARAPDAAAVSTAQSSAGLFSAKSY